MIRRGIVAISFLSTLLPLAACSSDDARSRESAAGSDSSSSHTTEATSAMLAAAAGVSVGSEAASVVIYELSDFQCPACKMAAERFLPALKEAYVEKGLVRFVFVDFPLVSIHPNALPAALAARCALEQDAFWPYHDRLFHTQEDWRHAADVHRLFVGYAADLGLDGSQFETCLAERRYQQDVQHNLDTALGLQARGTPTFYVNGKAIVGAGREVVNTIEAALRGDR